MEHTITTELTMNYSHNNHSEDSQMNSSTYIDTPAMSSAETSTIVIYRIILPIICMFGILGIIITIIVLSRKVMCTSTNCYLMALAVADLLFLVIFASILLADNQFQESSRHGMHFEIYHTYAIIFMQVFLIASIWLTVMLALERYVAICRPFLAARVCTPTKARCIIIGVYLFALVCRISNFWESKIVTFHEKGSGVTYRFIDYQTELSKNTAYKTAYPWVMDGVITSIIPFLSLLILNVLLIRAVRKSTRYLQKLTIASRGTNTIQKEEVQITIMLISVIMVFFFCQAPYVSYTAIVSIKHVSVSPGLKLFRQITMLLLALKSAINFIIYCWFSEKFWATLKQTFCLERCRKMHKNVNRQTSTNGTTYYDLTNCNTRDTAM